MPDLSRTLLALATLLATAALTPLHAQFSKTMHTSFEADSARVIRVDIVGEVSVEPWAGNTVLVETRARLYNSSKGVFDYFVEREGRYDVLAEVEGETLRLYSKVPERKTVQSKSGVAREEVLVRVLLPKAFLDEAGSVGTYTRTETPAGSR